MSWRFWAHLRTGDLWRRSSIDYNRVDVDALGTGACLQAAVQLENAFNSDTKTVGQWNECIYDFDFDCDTVTIMPGMQDKWLRASRAIDRSENLLDSLDPSSSTYDADLSAGIA
jgi:hypothetical protein